ncbi:MAG: dipeptide epimerase, partial [Planctomycetales bacterium]|nr:dipeptide epimerase [Planctomycetales bacterium]
MQLTIHAFDLPLAHTFTISRESITVQKTLIVELEEDGFRGYGEATTNNYYGFTFENMAAALERVRQDLESQTLDDPVTLWQQLHPKLNDN